MELYTLLRHFADSWMLLTLFSFFIGIGLWVIRPGSTRTYADTAAIPFRNEDAPAGAKATEES
jgi:cytochrome c oxidase cbb3-type subunit IV